MRISAPRSSLGESSLTGRDEEAPQANFDLPARVLRALADCMALSADCEENQMIN